MIADDSVKFYCKGLLEPAFTNPYASSMNEENPRISTDLVRWLKMRALPSWAQLLLALLMLGIVSIAVLLFFEGLIGRNKDAISVVASIIAFAMPIGLVLVALVFSDAGKKLKLLTHHVLSVDVPQAIRENLSNGHLSDAQLSFVAGGYIANCELMAFVSPRPLQKLRFRMELKMKKTNSGYRTSLRHFMQEKFWSLMT
jgi:hypothetical protein